ncbi:MAG: ribosome small subunit-dependent GTPase A [Chitinophagales bacterium]
MKGKVIQSTGSWYIVRTENGEEIACRIKGKFRLSKLKTTNPVAVGDNVEIDTETGLNTAIISKIYDRKNYIIRQSARHRLKKHIIASNLDQALLIITFSQPRTSLGFVDRFLLNTEMYDIPTTLVFNKQDIYSARDMAKYKDAKALYERLGYEVLLVSAMSGHNIEALKDLMKDKTSLIAGHSGVGKSTLINAIDSNLEINTKEISTSSGKGQHTTTFATLYELPLGGEIIDTPGIKNFGTVYLEPEEVGLYFREMCDKLQECKFSNCKHISERNCAVKDAIRTGKIAISRYENYLSILDEIESTNYWERDI